MNGQRVGYKRVSSIDQNPARQLEGMQLDRTFTDTVSGKNTDRPRLQEMLEYIREVTRYSRIALTAWLAISLTCTILSKPSLTKRLR